MEVEVYGMGVLPYFVKNKNYELKITKRYRVDKLSFVLSEV